MTPKRKIAENVASEFMIPELRDRGTNLLVELFESFEKMGAVGVLKELDQLIVEKTQDLGAVYKKEFNKR